jgi:hypothetical protein
MLVLNAGIFPSSEPLQDIAADAWQRIMSVNVEAPLRICSVPSAARAAPRGGRIVVIGSKNVPAPGPGAGAYSASKAALNQLARVAALEWGKDGIRINRCTRLRSTTPALWTDEVLGCARQGLQPDVEQYKKKTCSRPRCPRSDVAELAAEMCGRCSPRPPPRRCRSTAATSASSDGKSSRSAGRATASSSSTSASCPTRRSYVTCRTAREVQTRSATWSCAARRRSAALQPLGCRSIKARPNVEFWRKAGPTAVNLSGARPHEEARRPRARGPAIFARTSPPTAPWALGAELIPGQARAHDPLQRRRAATAGYGTALGVIRRPRSTRRSR